MEMEAVEGDDDDICSLSLSLFLSLSHKYIVCCKNWKRKERTHEIKYYLLLSQSKANQICEFLWAVVTNPWEYLSTTITTTTPIHPPPTSKNLPKLSTACFVRARFACFVFVAFRTCRRFLSPSVSCAGFVSWVTIYWDMSAIIIIIIIIIIIYPTTAMVVGAPHTISQPVSSILPCSPLPSVTWRTPGLSISWCCLPTSSSVCLVFFPLSLCLKRCLWPDLMNGKHDHTTAVCVSLQWSGLLWSDYLLDPGTDLLVGNMVFV